MKKPSYRPVNQAGSESSSGSAAAPVGGWNTRDAIANMSQTDAVILDNFYPSSTSVDLRRGSQTWATGFSTRIQTLMDYASGSLKKLFGADSTGIYDITVAGAIGAAATTLTNGYCQFVNFSTPAGSFLLSVNGLDKLKLFDGTTWTTIDNLSTPAITNLATTSIINISSFKNRIWFVEKNSLNVWYLPVASIGGAATKFPLSGLFTRGGYLMSMATWTIDGGGGVDDFAVFATSEGEIAVYQGTDPSGPETWGLVGIFYIGEPLGRRCFTKYGGDLLYLCKQGLFPLSRALQSASVERTIALSDKINPTFSESASLYGSNLGWQTTVFPSLNMVLVNVPAYIGTASYQYVMNSTSQAWCRFTDWNASCFFVWNSRLFYGSETTVVEAYVGSSDNSAYITGVALTAYTYLKAPGRIKHFKLIRPMLQITGSYDMYIGVATDFDESVDYSLIPASLAGGSLWDVALWDVGMWGGGPVVVKRWNSVSVNDGFAVAAKLQIRTQTSQVSWQSTDYIYEKGGML